MAKQISAPDARQLIEPGWNRLTELLAAIPSDRAEEPGVNGKWSLKLVVGHIAYWEQNAARIISLMAKGEPLPPIDFNIINREVAEKQRDQSYADLRQELFDAHDELLRILDETGEVDKSRLGGDTWGHYPEHIRQIERWWNRASP